MTGSDAPSVRYDALDATRSAAMMLGIFFHGAISFMETPIGWAVQDRSTHLAVDVLVWISHTFRIPVFFLMSGFFARLLYERRGPGGLLVHRAKRILVPFVVAVFPIVISLYFLWEWGAESAPPHARGLDVPEPGEPPPISAAHLWFLYYLILTYALISPLLFLRRSLGGRMDTAFRGIAGSVLLPFAMAIPTAFTLSFMASLEAETPVDLVPQFRILGYYLVFFGFGWLLHRQPEILALIGRRAWTNLVLGVIALTPVLVVLEQSLIEPNLDPLLHVTGLYLSALVTWLLGLSFIGLFVKYLSHPRPWVRWLSDASYWSYIVHLPVAVCFQVAVADLSWPGPVKYALIMAATIGICLVTYRTLVRYTIIGTMLNGPKCRVKPAEGAALASE